MDMSPRTRGQRQLEDGREEHSVLVFRDCREMPGVGRDVTEEHCNLPELGPGSCSMGGSRLVADTTKSTGRGPGPPPARIRS